MAVLVCGNAIIADAQPVSREYQLKAVFLFHFAQFTEWPTNAFTSKDDPIVIGVLGIDPFGSALDQTVAGERVGGRRLIVERFRTIEEVNRCHILFVSPSEVRRFESIAIALRGKPILTVADAEGAAYRGIMVRMFTQENRIRLRINLDALNASGVTVSSKLLRAAEVITTDRGP